MKSKHFILEWILALILGFGLGLSYAWVISPVKFVDTDPHLLRADFKDRFRSVISAAYASNGDLERARARLNLLGDPDPAQALSAQAQRMLASGESAVSVQQVALLASALQGQVIANTETPIPTDSFETPFQPVSEITATATNEPVESPLPVETKTASTEIPQLTSTPRPTRTPTPTLGAPYQLVGQDIICEPDLAEGLLQIYVTNARRKQVPGAEIIVTWNNGEEHIFTGLKPEISNGYADYLMTPGVSYSVRMADGGTPASDLTAPNCTDTSGNSYLGGLRLTFQHP